MVVFFGASGSGRRAIRKLILYGGYESRAPTSDRQWTVLPAPFAVPGQKSCSRKMRSLQTLRTKANGFLIQIQDLLRAELLEKHDACRLLARLANHAPYRSDSMQLKFDAFLDQQLVGSTLECQRDRVLRVAKAVCRDRRRGRLSAHTELL